MSRCDPMGISRIRLPAASTTPKMVFTSVPRWMITNGPFFFEGQALRLDLWRELRCPGCLAQYVAPARCYGRRGGLKLGYHTASQARRQVSIRRASEIGLRVNIGPTAVHAIREVLAHQLVCVAHELEKF